MPNHSLHTRFIVSWACRVIFLLFYAFVTRRWLAAASPLEAWLSFPELGLLATLALLAKCAPNSPFCTFVFALLVERSPRILGREGT